MTVRVEVDGPVTTVIIDRPEVRNAVDRETADALRQAFAAFDADDDASVAVFTGDHGTFSAGYDLKSGRSRHVLGRLRPQIRGRPGRRRPA